jgi:hypothetical protein
VRETFGPSIDAPGEPPFQFVADLSSTRIPFRGSSLSQPADGEVDLSQGWTLKKPALGSGIPARWAEEFQAYLRAAFGAEMGLAEESTPGSKRVEIILDLSIAQEPGSFQLTIRTEAIQVV